MRVVDIIRKKRDGEALERHEIEFIVAGVTGGTIPSYQTAALLMAIVLRGMSVEETAALTGAMVRSGERVDLSDLPGVPVDKHSTGGVGDKTSLVIAPLAAACGVIVPMMSGRALGHTGGTLDKLESIPAFRTGLSLAEFRTALAEIGCALIGQTAEVAPADRRLYALRDVTATVESIPLISASIMSKKVAEGIGGLVLDVKVGSGAFMPTEPDGRRLAESLVSLGRASHVRTAALLTDMDAPLGRAVGNAVEVVECVETLKGRGPADLESLSLALAARMLVLAGAAGDPAEGGRRVRAALASGAGLEKLRQIVARQGGDPAALDDYRRLPRAPERETVTAPRSGYVGRIDAGLIGRATMMLGAGRDRLDAPIDHGVGVVVLAPRGTRVRAGEPILELHVGDRGAAERARPLYERAIQIVDEPPPVGNLILGVIE
jgi:pyrimidine-nucleoside phosphorylase